jgi:hypothetical protein
MIDVDTVLKETLTSIEASHAAKSGLGDLLRQYRNFHSIHQKDLASTLKSPQPTYPTSNTDAAPQARNSSNVYVLFSNSKLNYLTSK